MLEMTKQQQQQQQYFADQHNASEAMDVDPPSASLAEDLYLNGDIIPGPAQLDVIAELNGGDHTDAASVAMAPREDVVPMVFKWEHGGRNVFITGTFNGWDKQCPMHRSGNDFTYIANLTRGKHMYKFVVDDDWRFAPDQLTMADVEGNVNNYVDVSEFAPLSDFDGKNKSLDDDDDDAENPYSRYIPEIDEYTKEPPPLPPHLRHIILNKAPPTVDGRLLPVPQHVALNHLYCTAIKDGMMVLGITNRYKQKFVTTVYYSLMPGAN
uniref:Association with the SNF1 complex (ASC) domain-containing protein n=1 Tax=Peronospora matthiolae TaxID=2874970 RepID=A0AAV1TTR9_9STRA